MDLKQFKMDYGEELWGKKYNNFVEAVAQAFGGGSNAPLSVQTLSGTDAVVPLNGATANGSGHISWIQLNGVKIVELGIYLTIPKGSMNMAFGQIPASLAPTISDQTTHHSASGFGTGENANQVEIDNKGQLWSNGSGFTTWSTVYFHVDKS